MAGSHFHLADVIDKGEHARKRKILSSAYAIKHLEDWEYKVAEKVEQLIKHLDSICAASKVDTKPEAIVDFRAWSNYFTMYAIVEKSA